MSFRTWQRLAISVGQVYLFCQKLRIIDWIFGYWMTTGEGTDMRYLSAQKHTTSLAAQDRIHSYTMLGNYAPNQPSGHHGWRLSYSRCISWEGLFRAYWCHELLVILPCRKGFFWRADKVLPTSRTRVQRPIWREVHVRFHIRLKKSSNLTMDPTTDAKVRRALTAWVP